MAHIVIDARLINSSTGRYVERLLCYIQEVDKDNDYTVLLSPEDFDNWNASNPRFKKLSSSYKKFTFGEQLGLAWQIYQLKADLVHFSMTQQPVLYFGKIITTIHDLTAIRFRNPAKNRVVFDFKQMVYKQLIKKVAKKSAYVITSSEFVKRDVAQYAKIDPEKIVVTYEAADKITEPPAVNEKLVNEKFLLYVGRPQPHKNLGCLVEAFAVLKQTHPELKLVLVGKKDVLYNRLEESVKKNKIGGVVFTGFISEGQLRWLYENTAAYVFPSLSEGFGLPGLEAMAHNAPVVSSNATCLPEIYKDAAIYFDPNSVQDMANKIGEILSDSKLRSRLVANSQKLVAKYSWRRMAEQTLEVYEQILRK
jgi:glycosyltransferase involved in cell wall biosynthesis